MSDATYYDFVCEGPAKHRGGVLISFEFWNIYNNSLKHCLYDVVSVEELEIDVFWAVRYLDGVSDG